MAPGKARLLWQKRRSHHCLHMPPLDLDHTDRGGHTVRYTPRDKLAPFNFDHGNTNLMVSAFASIVNTGSSHWRLLLQQGLLSRSQE